MTSDILSKEEQECKSTIDKFGNVMVLGVWGCSGSITTIEKRWSVHFDELNITKERAYEIAKKINEVLSQ